MQLFHALALLAAATAVLAAGPSVTTPTTSIIANVPLQIKWTGGSSPYTLVINTFANNAQTGVVKTVTSATSPYTYTPSSNLVGKQLQFDVTDSTGAIGQSGGTATVISSSGSSGSTASSSDDSSSSSASAAASTADAKSSASSSTSAAASHSSSSAAAKSTTSSKSPAGTVRVASAAVAGIVGVAAAALL